MTQAEVKSEFSICANMLEIGYAANLKARHTATAIFVSNKRQGRKHVLDRCMGQLHTKQIMKNTSFATPDLFGPPPESLLTRLHGALGNRSLSYTLRPQQYLKSSSFLQRRRGAGFKRKPFHFPSAFQRANKRQFVSRDQSQYSQQAASSSEFFRGRGSNRTRFTKRRPFGGRRGRR